MNDSALAGEDYRDVEPDVYRELLGAFGSGVTVVTVANPDEVPTGMTASAVSAVSLSPPVLLVCVDRAASFHTSITRAHFFAINILGQDQQNASQAFAGELEDPFSNFPYTSGPRNLPLLAGTVGHIICHVRETHEVGDHSVIFATVIGGETSNGSPLLHYRGQYTSIRADSD